VGEEEENIFIVFHLYSFSQRLKHKNKIKRFSTYTHSPFRCTFPRAGLPKVIFEGFSLCRKDKAGIKNDCKESVSRRSFRVK
jgi:hypothetical protein